jgi:tetratricopeptide (TPR) repeat protein
LHDLRNSLQNQLEELESAEQQAREMGNDKQAWNLFVEREAAERALWTIHGQYLGYLVLSDAENGLAAFEKAWEQATEEYRFSYRAVLISQVQKFRDRLSLNPTQEYRIDLRRAQYFLDGGMYEQAERLLRTVLERFEDTPRRQVELLIQLGNVVIRRGQFEEGLSLFDRATQISREQSIPKWLVRALNALGWASRLMGRLEEATRHYHRALKLSLDLQDKWRQAWLMNNLGYVHALRRNRDTALRLCEQALELWKDIGFERGIGATYNTLGEIAIEFDQLETAVSYFNNALDIFESEQDSEWLSSAYCGRGAAFWLLGDLNEAQEDLERARDIGLERDRPIILHRLAHVYLDRRDYKKAKRLFEESYQVSRAAPDPFYELNSLGDLARIAILEKEWEKKDEISTRFTDFKERHHGIRYRLPEGLLLRYLGDLNLCAGEIDKAANLYEEALPLIAESGSYQPYTITGQIKDMETIVLPNIDAKQIENLGRRLERFWAVERYDETHPEALPSFAHWKTWRRAE